MTSILVSLPTVLGLLIAILLATVFGVIPYWLTRVALGHRLDGQAKDVGQNLFRISGALLALLVSLTFADVRSELSRLRDAVEFEAAEIVDIHADLGRFQTPEATALQSTLRTYTQSLIDREWPALAEARWIRGSGP